MVSNLLISSEHDYISDVNAYNPENTAIAELVSGTENICKFIIGTLGTLELSDANAPVVPGYRFAGWYDENGNPVTQATNDQKLTVVMGKTGTAASSPLGILAVLAGLGAAGILIAGRK